MSGASIIVVGLGVPVGKCMYNELSTLKSNQVSFAPMLAGFDDRLENVEDDMNRVEMSVHDIDVTLAEVRGDIRNLGRKTNTDVSSTASEDDSLILNRGTGG